MASRLVADNSYAREIFDTANEILGYDILSVCTNGPSETLNQTRVSQPAIFVASMAALGSTPRLHLCQHTGHDTVVAMGLSLGEYSALCFAGCFSFEDGVRITRARGEAMQAASQQAPSGMVAVVGLNEPAVLKLVDRICEEAGSNSIFVANYLSDHNFTLAGSESACKAATAIGRSHGAKLVRALPVSGAFHTRYMETAAAALSDAVNAADFKVPTIPVMSNVTGRPHDFDCNKIKEKLIQQLVEPVKWSQSLNWVLSNTVTDQVDVCEVGPGTVCSDLVKKYSKVKSPLLSIRCLPA